MRGYEPSRNLVVIPVGSLESILGLLKRIKIQALQDILSDRKMRVVDGV